MDFEPLLEHWCINKGASPRTIKSYRNDLKQFQFFLADQGVRRVTRIDHGVINAYVEHMLNRENPRFHRAGFSDSTISWTTSAPLAIRNSATLSAISRGAGKR